MQVNDEGDTHTGTRNSRNILVLLLSRTAASGTQDFEASHGTPSIMTFLLSTFNNKSYGVTSCWLCMSHVFVTQTKTKIEINQKMLPSFFLGLATVDGSNRSMNHVVLL